MSNGTDNFPKMPPYPAKQKTTTATERAVSPAESVDTPEGNWPKDFREIIKAAEDAAEAEGRRSAMEELAKEKERADKAEALAAKYDVELDGAISTRDYYHEMADKLAQAIAEYFDADIGEHSSANCPWREALVVIEEAPPRKPLTKAEIAARQAPDLSSLNLYDATEDGIELDNAYGRYCLLADVQALLSSTAQPLRITDAMVDACYDFPDRVPKAGKKLMRETLERAFSAYFEQPLQQEGGKEVDADPAKRLRLIATKLGLGSAIPESDEELWGCTFSVLGMIRRKVEELLAQPSDKLQQAGTAQAEPCGGCGNADPDKRCLNCRHEFSPKEAASATDAGLNNVKRLYAKTLGRALAAEEELERLKTTPAQATPEGGQDEWAEFLKEGETPIMRLKREIRDSEALAGLLAEARAALAATTAAEPIIWIDADAAPHEDQGELIDGIHQITLLGSTKGPFGRYTTPLYRAAPPQQVDTGGLPG